MAFLKFKMGEYKNLAAATKSAGTVYVTTDERGMWIDVSDTERIRLQGSVLCYATVEEFNAAVAKPYNPNVIYFIAANNALMRWSGSEWIQLNVTAAVAQEKFTEFAGAIAANAQAIKDHGDAIEANAE